MNESQFTSGLLKRLRNAGAVAVKHSEMFSTGVPDFSLTYGGKTTWWEVKMERGRVDQSLRSVLEGRNQNWQAQRDFVVKLARAGAGAGYLVWFPKTKLHEHVVFVLDGNHLPPDDFWLSRIPPPAAGDVEAITEFWDRRRCVCLHGSSVQAGLTDMLLHVVHRGRR